MFDTQFGQAGLQCGQLLILDVHLPLQDVDDFFGLGKTILQIAGLLPGRVERFVAHQLGIAGGGTVGTAGAGLAACRACGAATRGKQFEAGIGRGCGRLRRSFAASRCGFGGCGRRAQRLGGGRGANMVTVLFPQLMLMTHFGRRFLGRNRTHGGVVRHMQHGATAQHVDIALLKRFGVLAQNRQHHLLDGHRVVGADIARQ